MNKVAGFLIEAKKLIEDPTKWTQGWFAKNAIGSNVSSLSESVVCFCSLGALERTEGRELWDTKYGERLLSRDAQVVLETAMKCSVENYNDTHTHAEVMQKWDDAIELAKQKEV